MSIGNLKIWRFKQFLKFLAMTSGVLMTIIFKKVFFLSRRALGFWGSVSTNGGYIKNSLKKISKSDLDLVRLCVDVSQLLVNGHGLTELQRPLKHFLQALLRAVHVLQVQQGHPHVQLLLLFPTANTGWVSLKVQPTAFKISPHPSKQPCMQTKKTDFSWCGNTTLPPHPNRLVLLHAKNSQPKETKHNKLFTHL